MKKLFESSAKLILSAFFCSLFTSSIAQVSTLEEMRNKLHNNIVEVDVEGERSIGLICGEFNGGLYVLTVRHVFGKDFNNLSNQGIARKRITIPSLRGASASCSYFSQFEDYDFAILKVTTSINTWYRFGLGTPPKVENDIQFVIFDNGRKIEKGYVSSVSATDINGTPKYFINSNGPVSNGVSGAPVFTKEGVIGILTSTDQSEKEVLPISDVIRILENEEKRHLFQFNPNFRKVSCQCRFGADSDGIVYREFTVHRGERKVIWERSVGYNKHPYKYRVFVQEDLGVRVEGNHPDVNHWEDGKGPIVYCRGDESSKELKKITYQCKIVDDNVYLSSKGCRN